MFTLARLFFPISLWILQANLSFAADEVKTVRTDLYGDPLPPGAICRLGSLRFKHPSLSVESLAFSPDGKKVASASRDRVVLWDRATGKRLRVFDIGYFFKLAIGFTADGKVQVVGAKHSGPEAKTIPVVLLRPEDEKKETQLDLDFDFIWQRAAFSADGKRLLSAARKKVVLWDVAVGPIAEFPISKEEITALALSPDCQTAACVEYKGKRVHLVDIRTQKILRQLNALPNERMERVAFSPDGKTLISAESSGIRLWDAATGKELRRFGADGDYHTFLALAVSPDGKTPATTVEWSDPRITLWDVATGKRIQPPEVDRQPVSDPTFIDDKTVVTIGHSGVARYWDARSGKCRRSFGAEDRLPSYFAVSCRGNLLAGWFEKGRFGVWDVETGKSRWQIMPSFTDITNLYFSPDGKMLMGRALSENGQRFVCWDAETGQALTPLLDDIRDFSFSLSADGTTATLWTRDGDQRLCVRPKRSWRRLGQRIKAPKDCYTDDLSPDGRLLVVMGRMGSRLGLVECASGNLMGWLTRQSAEKDVQVEKAAFSADGTLLASTHSDRTVRIWDVATRREIERFVGHEVVASRVAFSPDGRLVASKGHDHTVLIWKRRALRSQETGRQLSRAELETMWRDLAGANADAAQQAVWVLASSPRQSVPFLDEHLQPTHRGDTRRIQQWIADLGSESYEVRQKARNHLEMKGEEAEDMLEEALEEKPSLELRRRVLELLEKPENVRSECSPDNLRTIRAVQVLETIGTPGARQVLKKLSEGGSGALRTQQARTSLRRLERKLVR